MKKFVTIAAILLMLLIALLLVGGYAAGSVREGGGRFDPYPSYSQKDKIPYGTYVLFDRLKDFFPHAKIKIAKKNPKDYLAANNYFDDTDSSYTYILLAEELSLELFEEDYANLNDYLNADALLAFVEAGNTLFMAAREFDRKLMRRLQCKSASSFSLFSDTLTLKNIKFFQHPDLQAYNPIDMEAALLRSHLQTDSSKAVVYAADDRNHPVLIELQHESGGRIILCSLPLLFTNYYLLKDKHRYARLVNPILSLLPPNNHLIWDEYYKPANLAKERDKGERDWMRFINSHPPLLWAFRLIIAAMVLYMFFAMKRTQRIIPVITPLKNASLEFTQTIGKLYYRNGNHSNIAEKKIRFFLDFVRTNFYLKTQQLDNEFCELLAHKSGTPLPLVTNIVKRIQYYRAGNEVSEEGLNQFSVMLEEFYAEVRD